MMVMIVVCRIASHDDGDDSGMPHCQSMSHDDGDDSDMPHCHTVSVMVVMTVVCRIAGHDDGNATLPAIIMVMITVSQSQTHTVPTLWP